MLNIFELFLGVARGRSEVTKQVMFSDGIRPGGDLTELDGSAESRQPIRRPGRTARRVGTPPGETSKPPTCPALDPNTQSYLPAEKGYISIFFFFIIIIIFIQHKFNSFDCQNKMRSPLFYENLRCSRKKKFLSVEKFRLKSPRLDIF